MTDILLGQGDKDDIGVILSDANGAADLSSASVKFIIENDMGDTRHEITCTLGGTVEGVYYAASAGGVTIVFSDTETAKAGLFFGEFKVTIGGYQTTFPSENNLTIKIKESL